MVNEVILDYLRENKDKFPIESIKEKVLSSGYLEEEFNEAINELNLQKSYPPVPIPDYIPVEITTSITTQNKVGHSKMKWILIAAIIGFIFLISSITFTVLDISKNGAISAETSLTTPVIISVITGSILAIFYFIGFIKLGKITDSRLLKYSSISTLLILIILAGSLFFLQEPFQSAVNQLNGRAITGFEGDILISSISLSVLAILLFSSRTAFAIALIRIRNLAKFSLWTGIAELIVLIISSAFAGYTLYLIFVPEALIAFSLNLTMIDLAKVGWIVLQILITLSIALESLTLFFASRKFESKK